MQPCIPGEATRIAVLSSLGTLDLELAGFMLSAQHEELPQYNAPHARPAFASQLYEPRADESAKSYEAQSIIYELRQDSPRKLL